MSHTPPLLRRMPHPRVWLWAMVALLLIKGLVPLLAVAAARSQGVALVEVCSIYGTRLVPVDGPAEPAPPAHGQAEGHCTLASALGPWAPLPAITAPPGPRAEGLTLPGRFTSTAAPRDASQRWLMARLHAPPHPA